MNAGEFVSLIGELKPKTGSITCSEYSKDYIELILDSYTINPKSEVYNDEKNEILNLISNYKLNLLNIHDVQFLNEKDCYSLGDLFFFGKYDIFLVGHHLISNEIVTYDLGNDEKFLSCAKNPEKFLDALYRLKIFETQRFLRENLSERFDTLMKVTAKDCSKLSGGNQYEEFYNMVLGI